MQMRRHFLFYRYLYTDSSIKNIKKFKHDLVHGKVDPFSFLIVRSCKAFDHQVDDHQGDDHHSNNKQNSFDQLEIIRAVFLTKGNVRDTDIMVYGIASSYDNALDLIVQISDEAAECGIAGELINYLEHHLC